MMMLVLAHTVPAPVGGEVLQAEAAAVVVVVAPLENDSVWLEQVRQ